MSCMCLAKLKAFLESLKNIPLNALAAMIPEEIPQLTMLGGMASGSATASALARPPPNWTRHCGCVCRRFPSRRWIWPSWRPWPTWRARAPIRFDPRPR